MKGWLANELLERRQSNLWVIWAVICTGIYSDYGWWAAIPLVIGAVVVTALEEHWEAKNDQ